MAEEKFNKNEISTLIQNFLTLRYDPFQKSFLPNLTSINFEPKIKELSLENIETLLQNYILKKFSEPPKRITISLSGGIDSTLILALLRKTLPDTEICALSIRFADSVDETSYAKKIAEKFDAIRFDVIKKQTRIPFFIKVLIAIIFFLHCRLVWCINKSYIPVIFSYIPKHE